MKKISTANQVATGGDKRKHEQKKKINKLKDRSIEIVQFEQNEENKMRKNEQKFKPQDPIKCNIIQMIESRRREEGERGRKKI